MLIFSSLIFVIPLRPRKAFPLSKQAHPLQHIINGNINQLVTFIQ